MDGAVVTAFLVGGGLFLLGVAAGLAVGTLFGRRSGGRVALAWLPLELRAILWREDRCPTCGQAVRRADEPQADERQTVEIDTPGSLCYH